LAHEKRPTYKPFVRHFGNSSPSISNRVPPRRATAGNGPSRCSLGDFGGFSDSHRFAQAAKRPHSNRSDWFFLSQTIRVAARFPVFHGPPTRRKIRTGWSVLPAREGKHHIWTSFDGILFCRSRNVIARFVGRVVEAELSACIFGCAGLLEPAGGGPARPLGLQMAGDAARYWHGFDGRPRAGIGSGDIARSSRLSMQRAPAWGIWGKLIHVVPRFREDSADNRRLESRDRGGGAGILGD